MRNEEKRCQGTSNDLTSSQAVHDSIFVPLKKHGLRFTKEFHGDSKVVVIRLQSLRRDFENLTLKEDETIADFLSRCVDTIS